MRIVDCKDREFTVGDDVAFVSGGQIKTGQVIELGVKFPYVSRYGAAPKSNEETRITMRIKSGQSIYRTRHPQRCMRLDSQLEIEGVKRMVPLYQQ